MNDSKPEFVGKLKVSAFPAAAWPCPRAWVPMLRLGRRSRRQMLTCLGLALIASVRAAPEDYTWLAVAGPVEEFATLDGMAPTLRLNQPLGVAVDAAGNVYVAQVNDHVIRKVSPAGEITTLAGMVGKPGSADGQGAVARFNTPYGLAMDRNGWLYVADYANHTIRKISAAGEVTTIAGVGGIGGFADGPANMAKMNCPTAVAVDDVGNVWFSDRWNHVVRKLTPQGMVVTVAGRPGLEGNADGQGAQAQFRWPAGLALDARGNVYLADQQNHTIRRITPDGNVTTLAGRAGTWGYVDGLGGAARFDQPFGLTFGADGSLYVAPHYNHSVRKVTLQGLVSTFAGSTNGAAWFADGQSTAARFWTPHGIAADLEGNLLLADLENKALRRITRTGLVTTVAGLRGFYGSRDGPAESALFANPSGCKVDAAGNIYVSDWNNCAIRKISPAGAVTTFAGKLAEGGERDGQGGAARFYYPAGLAISPAGDLYVSDYWGYTIRRITPSGFVTTVAGSAGNPGTQDGQGTAARFRGPARLAFDRSGDLYISDSENHTIRKMDTNQIVVTLAGQPGVSGSADGPCASASFNLPRGLAVDEFGTVYVADRNNHTIRKITTNGIVSTVAGTAGAEGSVDATGSAARFAYPEDIVLNAAGNLIVSGSYRRLRTVTPAGVVTILANQPGVHMGGDATGPNATFADPAGLALDDQGNIYVADWGAHNIRRSFPACPDQPTIDQPIGLIGATRQLDTSPRTANSWAWEIIRRPTGSRATLSSATARNPRFMPDIADRYIFRLRATNLVGAITLRTVEFTALAGPRGGTFYWLTPSISTFETVGAVTLEIRREGDLQHAASVDFETVDGTAFAGEDYLPAGGRSTFAPGETSRSIHIGLVNDPFYEPPEAFTLQLSNASPGWALAGIEAVVTLTDEDPPAPRIVAQPVSVAVLERGMARFTVTVAGAEPLAYQWRFGATEMAGATQASLVFTNVSVAQAGDYQVSVTNAFGSVTSVTARLAVLTRLPVVSVGRTENGLPLLSLSGDAVCQYALEYVPSLASTSQWQTLTTLLVTNPPVLFSDESASTDAIRFYRLRVVP